MRTGDTKKEGKYQVEKGLFRKDVADKERGSQAQLQELTKDQSPKRGAAGIVGTFTLNNSAMGKRDSVIHSSRGSSSSGARELSNVQSEGCAAIVKSTQRLTHKGTGCCSGTSSGESVIGDTPPE